MTPPFRAGALLFTGRGVDDDSDAAILDRAVAAARAAEDHGFDDVWCTEHHCTRYGVSPSATTMAAFLLGATHRVQVGTAVTILPTHAPVEVAEQAALLDHLSHGRFLLGVGRGGPTVDYELLGRTLEHWRRGMPEALDLVLAAWDGAVTSDTDLYRFRPVAPVPRPRTVPHPPLWVAATSPRGLADAAARGLPMLMFFGQDDATKARFVHEHAELARAAGHPDHGYDHGFTVFAHVTDSADEARALVVERMLPAMARSRADYVLLEPLPDDGSGDLDPLAFAEHVLATHPVGTADACAERIVESVRVSGCRRVLLHVEASGVPDAVVDNVVRFATEVLPAVRDALARDPDPTLEVLTDAR